VLKLALIGLVGGLITGISPCVLPVLPVVFLSGGVSTSTAARSRPYLIVAGLVVSFSVITLAGTAVVDALPVPKDAFRVAGLVALVVLGVITLFPAIDELVQRPLARVGQRQVDARHGGLLLGLALGAVYVPCAGPVLAAITVAGATGQIGGSTLVLTAAFAVGAGIPLLGFALAGRGVVERIRAFRRRERVVRRAAGVLIIAIAVALTFNVTDVLQRTVPDYTSTLNAKLDKAGAQQLSAQTGSLASCAQDPSPELADCGAAPAISGITAWLNTPAGRAARTSGQVTLVDFWAYSCINCQRAIPHVEAWYRAYQSAGLQVVGVQTPEYAFERDPSDVAAGARRLHITYPIAVDDDYTTWNAFQNDAWPAEYLIDARGLIRHVAIGEGDYGTTETLIRQLLTAARPGVALPPPTDLPDTEPTDPDQTPETYLGAAREQTYAGGDLPAGRSTFTVSPVQDGTFALGGTWTVGSESLTSGTGARLVMGAIASHVYLDVGGAGTLTATCEGTTRHIAVSGAPDIYDVCDSGSRPATMTVTLALTPGLAAYSFTFG
jgi:cytochrome c biogenesis protein CcdA/thiol-disulfide isomerase/thioredoxin